MSSIRTPSAGSPPSSRMGTTSACTPRSWPPTTSWQNTAATVPSQAALPIHSLRAHSSGVWITNSSASGSYVAVVRRSCTLEPWPSSVMAKQPSSSAPAVRSRYSSWWRSVPRCWIAPPQRPNCTPHLTSSDRSPKAIVSNPVM